MRANAACCSIAHGNARNDEPDATLSRSGALEHLDREPRAGVGPAAHHAQSGTCGHGGKFVQRILAAVLDVHGLAIERAVELESRLNQITGVVAVGLFAARPADLLIVGGPAGVREITASNA